MSEVETTTEQPSTKQRLLELFQKLLPLVDSVSDKIRFAALLGFGLDVWIFVWLYFIKQFSAGTALVVAGILLVPVLILVRFWWALEEIKDLPNIAGRMVDDAKGEIRETVQGIQAGQVQKLSFLGSAKSLWSIGSMAGEARELLGSYISIGTLANPFALILGALSLVGVLGMTLLGLILLMLTLF
ncbi:hypothetical protein [Candidatus Thiothrix anitrata]|jgi:hypothetical protein|uniref:AI-2E family transporter n=1 Tax=Candidatus Thiothrix anitrata TaxID=2823902 RepID=A0ABX7X5I0_9GAMM|nr:hypothetical protein [Candidatus Thiothrix anitrata]QTR50622.1 hypothetical protein J8380_03365 [Candidatus Thiothrix anitrata]